MKKQVFRNWENSTFPFERIHLDFFHLKGKTYLVLVDIFSKWIRVKLMKKTDAQNLIMTLGYIFAYFGRPHSLNSVVFNKYCKERLIDLTHSPPYLPQSNGQAERGVQTVKNGLKKLLADENFCEWNMEGLINKFIFDSRNTLCVSINCTPAERILGFNPRKTIDSVLPVVPEVLKKFCCSEKKERELRKSINNNNMNAGNMIVKKREFEIDEEIWYRSYDNNGLYKWLKAKIVSRKVVTLIS